MPWLPDGQKNFEDTHRMMAKAALDAREKLHAVCLKLYKPKH